MARWSHKPGVQPALARRQRVHLDPKQPCSNPDTNPGADDAMASSPARTRHEDAMQAVGQFEYHSKGVSKRERTERRTRRQGNSRGRARAIGL